MFIWDVYLDFSSFFTSQIYSQALSLITKYTNF